MSDKASGTLFADEPQSNRVGGYVARQMATFEREFESLLANFPNRIRRKEAFRHYVADRKKLGERAPEMIAAAMANYLAELKRETWRKPQNAGTWFNNWRDWVSDGISTLKKFRDDYLELRRKRILELMPQVKALLAEIGDPDESPEAKRRFDLDAEFMSSGGGRWYRWKDVCAEVGIDPKGRA